MKTNRNILKSLIVSISLIVGAYSAAAKTDSLGSDVTESISVSNVKISVTDNGIEIRLTGEEPMDLTVYAITGQIVKSQSIEPGVVPVDLPRGYYIVRIGREAKRIVIN